MIKRQKQHLLIDSYEKIDGSSLLYRCNLKLYYFSFLPVISSDCRVTEQRGFQTHEWVLGSESLFGLPSRLSVTEASLSLALDSRKIDKWLFYPRYVKRFGCIY
ncbi:hypothetical protein GYMC52_1237 [Geobacillus sp. Y412MC52]|nr:hypothetical protein GYMC52_1237 [Geobacillus sp. Y412MC52]